MPLAARPVALITGSSGGIGEGIARRLAADGYAIVIHSRSSTSAGQAIATELGGIYLQADLTNEAERVALVTGAHAQWGRLDVLVNNAGISGVIPHDDLAAATPDIWHALYEVNVVAPFRLIAAAAPLMPGGCVVNISSHAGVRPKGASIPYAASKAALNHMTRLLALSLAPGIRVNAVAPGLVDTPLTVEWAEARRLWQLRAPMRRGATPSDIAAIVAMLVASDYITGEVVTVDGGLNLT